MSSDTFAQWWDAVMNRQSICKPKRIRLLALIMHCAIMMKKNHGFPGMYMKYVTEYSELYELTGNPDNHAITQTDPCVISIARFAEVEYRFTPCSILFSREGKSSREGCTDPDARITSCAYKMRKHAYQEHFDGKYTNENIYCQVSIITRE